MSPAPRTGVVAKEVEIPEISKRAQEALELVNKSHPEGLMLMSSTDIKRVPSISTGCLSIDMAIGTGGLPRGRIVEIFGPESSGKTTLCLHVIASAQKLGGLCAFIDAEHALDPHYATKLGVSIPDLLISQPDCGEQAIDIAQMLCGIFKEGDMIVVDSVPALVPKAELEGTMEDTKAGMGAQARLMSKAMRMLNGSVSKSGVLCMFVNQMRDNIGVMYGPTETTTGGRALKFYASVRIEIRRTGAVKLGEEIIANKTRVKVVKNKIAPPFKECEFNIRFGQGIDAVGDVLDIASTLGIVEMSGAWYSYGGERLGQGKENALTTLKGDNNFLTEIRKKVLESLNNVS
jgi:recombination protein RecA